MGKIVYDIFDYEDPKEFAGEIQRDDKPDNYVSINHSDSGTGEYDTTMDEILREARIQEVTKMEESDNISCLAVLIFFILLSFLPLMIMIVDSVIRQIIAGH